MVARLKAQIIGHQAFSVFADPSNHALFTFHCGQLGKKLAEEAGLGLQNQLVLFAIQRENADVFIPQQFLRQFRGSLEHIFHG